MRVQARPHHTLHGRVCLGSFHITVILPLISPSLTPTELSFLYFSRTGTYRTTRRVAQMYCTFCGKRRRHPGVHIAGSEQENRCQRCRANHYYGDRHCMYCGQYAQGPHDHCGQYVQGRHNHCEKHQKTQADGHESESDSSISGEFLSPLHITMLPTNVTLTSTS